MKEPLLFLFHAILRNSIGRHTALEQLSVRLHKLPILFLIKPSARQRHLHSHGAFRAKARVNAKQPIKAFAEQPRAYEQDERQRRLRHHQQAAQTLARLRRPAASGLLQACFQVLA